MMIFTQIIRIKVGFNCRLSNKEFHSFEGTSQLVPLLGLQLLHWIHISFKEDTGSRRVLNSVKKVWLEALTPPSWPINNLLSISAP